MNYNEITKTNIGRNYFALNARVRGSFRLRCLESKTALNRVTINICRLRERRNL